MKLLAALLLMVLFGFSAPLRAETEVPPYAPVVDKTHWLNSQETAALEKHIAEVRKANNVHIAVLIIESLDGEPIEQYAIRVADVWKVGKKGEDNGLLITIAKSDRKVRIDVGYGLEGTIPDLIAKRVIDKTLAPKLKSGQPYNALVGAIDMIVQVVKIEAQHASTPVTASDTPVSDSLDEIPFFGRLNTFGKIVATVLGVIGGILLLIGIHGESGEAALAGLLGPIAVGCVIGLLVNITQFIFVGVVAFIIAVVIALGLSLVKVGGGLFGGGGAGGDF